MSDEIRALERTRLEALVAGDSDTASQLHIPQLELITSSGSRKVARYPLVHEFA